MAYCDNCGNFDSSHDYDNSKPMEGLPFQTIVVLSRHTRKIEGTRRSPKSSTLVRIRTNLKKGAAKHRMYW